MTDKKGELKFKYIEHSKCPFCGAEIEDYNKSSHNKWEESVRFKCGCQFKSKTPTIINQMSMCKESKPYKKLKESRLKQLEKVNNFMLEYVIDDRLLKELKDKLKSIKWHIEDWWN